MYFVYIVYAICICLCRCMYIISQCTMQIYLFLSPRTHTCKVRMRAICNIIILWYICACVSNNNNTNCLDERASVDFTRLSAPGKPLNWTNFSYFKILITLMAIFFVKFH